MKMNDIIYTLLPILVGTCLPMLAITNGNLGKSFGSPFTATFGVFLVALAGITIVILAGKAPIPTAAQIGSTKWWYWIGGLIVVLNIVTFTVSPAKIGVGNMIVLFVAAQLISSTVFEHYGLVGVVQHTINWQRIAGIILLVAGVFLIKKF
ncbi:MAG: DMT family transporter [Pedobacter sp.]|jgi:transporter family-2 protein|uniref:DMT family transporter n=1 Tax=Pedobacter sp. TaxID=1411316 RepID=UPI003561B132